MDTPLISVVIPSWQSGKFLEQALFSVLQQQYPNLELIMVDNVSTDETPAILEKYKDHFAASLVEQDRGQSDAINKGMALATGDILCWLNADDLFLLGCLYRVAREFMYTAPDILTGDTVYIDAQGRVQKCALQPTPKPLFYNHGLLSLTAPAIFFSARSFASVGGLDETLHLSMDVDLCYRILGQNGKLRHMRGYWGAFRWHEQSKTSVDLARRKSRENDETKALLDLYLGPDRKTGLVLRLHQLRLLMGLYPLRRKWDCLRNRGWIEKYLSDLERESHASAKSEKIGMVSSS